MAQVNPYNIVAFYTHRPAFSDPASLVCGASLLAFQINKTSLTAVTSFSMIGEDGSEYAMDTADITTACTANYGYFATYPATGGAPNVPDGKYQYKVVLDSTTYYSHPFCVDSRFNNMYEKLIDYTIQQDAPDVYIITLSFTSALSQGRRTITFEQAGQPMNRTVWAGANVSTLTLTEADGTGNVSTVVTFSHEFGGDTWEQTWVLAFNSSDVSGTISFTILEETYNVAGGMYNLLTFRNATDISDMRLFYQGGYTQKLYIRGYDRAPQPITEERFQANAKGTPFFNSQTIAERRTMDFIHVPDYLQTVLKALQNHSAVTMYDTRLGSGESLANARPTFEFTPVEGDVILKGTFSYETHRAFVHCEENMEICS